MAMTTYLLSSQLCLHITTATGLIHELQSGTLPLNQEPGQHLSLVRLKNSADYAAPSASPPPDGTDRGVGKVETGGGAGARVGVKGLCIAST
jgi:hypothetical protein